MSDIRSDPATIDGPWLTEALESSGVARGATVTGVEFAGYVGTGQMGRNARFHLQWDQPDRPATVMAKFPTTDAPVRSLAFATGAYLKEWFFYSSIAPTVGVRAPKCYAARLDAAAEDFVILMEDLADSRQGDQIDGLTADQVSLAMEQAVALHAPRWGEADLIASLAGDQPVPERDMVAILLQAGYQAALPGFMERFAHRLEPEVVKLIEDFAGPIGRFVYGTGTPETIVHLDFRADNFLFGQTPSAPPLAVVDWQTYSVGIGMADVAYAISGSFPDPLERASRERDLLEEYRQRLGAAGIEMDRDQAWRDYRFASLWGLIITVVATLQAAQTERGDDMFTAMAARHGRQAHDLEALDLLH